MIDHQIENCRRYYSNFRRDIKSPPIIVFKHTWGMGFEAKDGSIYQEYAKETHCAWCVKAEGVSAWRDKFNPEGLLNKKEGEK